MNRFGKAIVAILVLALISIVSMVRFVDPPASAPAPSAATTDDAVQGEIAIAPTGLAVPVAGVRPEQLTDTFDDAREGHAHGALDIMAPTGTPVVAAAGGQVDKIFESEAGGHTVYVRSPDRRWIYYYAHLEGYAPGLVEGQRLVRGTLIGTVGFSGNASPAGPHLHFEIRRMSADEPWHGGRPIDPYRVLAPRAA
ncbi:M23 family metallopeptidase [Sphingomonas montana]|uniref:M23 family metallopeptidase n=1 Tax=Sphingomonas montana TaxID=1843236 RepID=UPI00096FA7BB|nr:M23 family metallopeptidase [Sphingomonas montana]